MRAAKVQAEVDLFTFMRTSHAQIHRDLARLMAAVEVDARADIHSNWVVLESELLAHMEAEERYVLPAFARIELGEARALLAEHASLRDQLLELAVAVELHYARIEMCEKLVATLEAHIKRETALLYRWAATRLDDRLGLAARRHIEAARAAR
jgi:Hemerythrin HHE cation binding domain